MSAAVAKALAAWKELNDRQQGTLAAIYHIDRAKEIGRKIDGARGDWSSTPAAVWRRIDFAHDPSDRRLVGTTELQNQLSYAGWDNQGNGSTMAALAERGLITRDSRATTFGWMNTVMLTRDGRATARAGLSLTPDGKTKRAALSARSWEVLAMLWDRDLRGAILQWGRSKTIDLVLIEKHVPPLAESVTSGYKITDRGKDFYREHYAAHVAAHPDVYAPHPDGAAAEPWPPRADEILSHHRQFYAELCGAWRDAYTAHQAAEGEANSPPPAATTFLSSEVTRLASARHRLLVKTAQQRAQLAGTHTDDLRQRGERAARDYATAALVAFAAAVAGTDPVSGLRPPNTGELDTWDEPPLPQPAQTGINVIDDRARKLHAAAVGAPIRRRGPAPKRPARRSTAPGLPPPGAALAALAEYLRGHVDDGALRRRMHGGSPLSSGK